MDTNTIYTDFKGITDNIYGFGTPFLLLHLFFTHLPIFLPVHNGFYLSKWRVSGSLHKAMGVWSYLTIIYVWELV